MAVCGSEHRTGASCMCTREGRMCFRRSDGLSGDFVIRLFEDREGNIWVATVDGLDRFRDLPSPRFL